MTFTGIVCETTLGKGSKSERRVIALKLSSQNGDEALVDIYCQLRRTGINPFEVDEELAPLIGQKITVEGTIANGQLFVESYCTNEN